MQTAVILIIGCLFGLTLTIRAEPIEVGQEAPQVKGVTEEGKKVNFGNYYKKGAVLVYFYPKADTPGCTTQACNLRDAYTELGEAGITVLGVSMDSPKDQKAFKEKYHLPFTLIADTKGKVVAAFGVPYVETYARRQAFLIKEGKIVWRDLQATPASQAEDALAALKQSK